MNEWRENLDHCQGKLLNDEKEEIKVTRHYREAGMCEEDLDFFNPAEAWPTNYRNVLHLAGDGGTLSQMVRLMDRDKVEVEQREFVEVPLPEVAGRRCDEV